MIHIYKVTLIPMHHSYDFARFASAPRTATRLQTAFKKAHELRFPTANTCTGGLGTAEVFSMPQTPTYDETFA